MIAEIARERWEGKPAAESDPRTGCYYRSPAFTDPRSTGCLLMLSRNTTADPVTLRLPTDGIHYAPCGVIRFPTGQHLWRTSAYARTCVKSRTYEKAGLVDPAGLFRITRQNATNDVEVDHTEAHRHPMPLVYLRINEVRPSPMPENSYFPIDALIAASS